MKKFFMAVIAMMMTISASAQFYIYYSDGTVAKVDSITMVAPADTEDPTNPDNPTIPDNPSTPSQCIGVFSVNATKQVTFSPGNLQYTQSTNTWLFAEKQYDYIGTDNVTGGGASTDVTWGDSKKGPNLADKIDLFGWSTSTTNFGVSTSTSDSDYRGSFVDWGTNQIGTDAPNTWRTLSKEEWYYLRDNRTNADDLVGVAQVNGVNGLILLPDNWTCPAGVTFKSGFHSGSGSMSAEYYAAYQTFTADQWSKLEAAGAIFLPAAGHRNGTSVSLVQCYSEYWSASENDNGFTYFLSFSSSGASMIGSGRSIGQSVRLVKDIEGEITTPYFSVSSTKFVTFSPGNLQYTQSTNTWSFAENQWDYIGTDNVTGGSVTSDQYGDDKSGTALADKVDLFGWSTNADGLFEDWGRNKIGNDAPNTWRTLSRDEWDYLLNGRPNASSLCGVAQVNGVNGLILLPDTWTCPAGVTFKSGFNSSYGVEYYAAYQTFTADQWSKLEESGAVFLPATGVCVGTYVSNVQGFGCYWSATEWNSYDGGPLSGYYLEFSSTGAYINGSKYSSDGRGVRLVKDL